MSHYSHKDLEGMNAADSSDSENDYIAEFSRSASPIQSTKLDLKSTAGQLPLSVDGFFQSFQMDCFPEAEGMAEKAQPWRQIWVGPQPPSKDGKLLVACPKNCQWGSGSGLGGY